MGTWRCPHCRTVQVESSACFLCGRSATSCGTCVKFRRSIVEGVGYCALDRGRVPLSGEERRDCWASAEDEPPDGVFALPGGAAARRGVFSLRPVPIAGPRAITGG